jgi:hypothetical protein
VFLGWRRGSPRLLTAGGVYVDDLRTPELNGAARVTFVRSPLAHARSVQFSWRLPCLNLEVKTQNSEVQNLDEFGLRSDF